MSTFALNHVQLLTASVSTSTRDEERPSAASSSSSRPPEEELQTLYSLLTDLKSPLDYGSLEGTLQTLTEHERKTRHSNLTSSAYSDEATNVKNIITARIIIGLYAQALDKTLKEACEADSEAEWWGDIERSDRTVVWYLIASELYNSFSSKSTEAHTNH